MCVCIYIYIYTRIYIERERDNISGSRRPNGRPGSRLASQAAGRPAVHGAGRGDLTECFVRALPAAFAGCAGRGAETALLLPRVRFASLVKNQRSVWSRDTRDLGESRKWGRHVRA